MINVSAADAFMTQNASLFSGRKRYQLDQLAFPATRDLALIPKLNAAKTMPEIKAALSATMPIPPSYECAGRLSDER